jgi:hypothetical protein
MPAICEEALCRGLIQYSFGGLRRKWLTVLIVGILFGIMHLDFYRFLPTMLLGLAMAYIMAETRNLLLPMLFHFINNAWSTVLSWATAPLTESLQTQSLSDSSGFLIGGSLLVCAVVPWLLIFGARPDKAERSAAGKTKAVGPDKDGGDPSERFMRRGRDRSDHPAARGACRLGADGHECEIHAVCQPEYAARRAPHCHRGVRQLYADLFDRRQHGARLRREDALTV